MTSPRFSLIPVIDHEIHVTEWGNPSNPAIVMWHGLSRTGRDFDELAQALSDHYFVLCPDTLGRGLSSWSSDPLAEYTNEYYAGIAEDLLDHYGIDRTGWIGTSMGGLIGMRIAASPSADRLKWLIINDIGPDLPEDALDRIRAYAGTQPIWNSIAEAEHWLRAAYTPFGSNTDEFWRRMARTSVRRLPDGTLTLHYDPAMMQAFVATDLAGPDPWARWDRITIPTHLIYGAHSDLVSNALANKMARRGPSPDVTCIPDVGHAPTLASQNDATLIRRIIADLTATN